MAVDSLVMAQEMFKGDIAARPVRQQDYAPASVGELAPRASGSSQSSGVVAGELGSGIPGFDAFLQYAQLLMYNWDRLEAPTA